MSRRQDIKVRITALERRLDQHRQALPGTVNSLHQLFQKAPPALLVGGGLIAGVLAGSMSLSAKLTLVAGLMRTREVMEAWKMNRGSSPDSN